MNLQTIRGIAKDLGIKSGKMKKADLIRTIQREEGNFDCFGTITDFCDQEQCSWRDDCLGSSKKRSS